MLNNLAKKGLVLIVISIFVMTPSSSYVIGDINTSNIKDDNESSMSKEIVKPLEKIFYDDRTLKADGIGQLFTCFNDVKDNNHVLYKIVNKAFDDVISITDDGVVIFDSPPPLGIYEFSPCDPIDINGEGYWFLVDAVLGCFLNEGRVNLNHTLSREYAFNEIQANMVFINFTGDLLPEDPPDNPLEPVNITVFGSADYGVVVEISLLVDVSSNKERYKWGELVTITIENIGKIGIDLAEPHFYVLNENWELVYEENIQDTWSLQPGANVVWNWDQKDKDKEQVPKGDYYVYGEFLINDRTHYRGTPSFYIKGKNEGITNQLLFLLHSYKLNCNMKTRLDLLFWGYRKIC
jgi:hypothetical protein